MKEIERKEHTIMEGNFLEYPIFSMQKRRIDKTVEEYVWQEKDGTGKLTTERKLKIDCTEGVPNYFDMDVFNAIMRIYVKKRGDLYKKNEAQFTIYELVKELDLPIHDGAKAKRIRESLERMAKTSLHFENAFYAKKEKLTKIIHLIGGIELYDKQKGNRLINIIRVILDDELVNSIERKYYKLIDFKIYKSLNSGIPRRLYEYLEKKKYRKNQFEIDIRKLAKWIGLKTSKISQLKGLLGKANNELKKKRIIDNWNFKKSNVIYSFYKSERLESIEEDLFHLENLVITFYESLGQRKVSRALIREGMVVLQDLIDEGYAKKDVIYTLGWTADNIKGIHSIRILPKVIGQALGDQESTHLLEEKQKTEQQKRLEEGKKREDEEEKARKLDRIFEDLPKEEQGRIEKQAQESLLEQGFKENFLLPTLLRIERNKLLEKKKALVKKQNKQLEAAKWSGAFK